MLAEWQGVAAAPMPKARGRSGPYAIPVPAPPPPAAGTSTTDALLAATIAIITRTLVPGNAEPAAHAAPNGLAPPIIQGRSPRSSPPPMIDEELVACLEAFARAHNLSDAALAAAVKGLEDASYSAGSIEEATADRLRELTQLPEGRVLDLKRFARRWCGKMDGKRARRA